MAQLSSQDYTSFTDIKARLEQIITSVKDKEVSLENSLDLFDEAIKLGSRAVDMVDAVDLDDSELLATDADALPHKNTSTTDTENDTENSASETDASSKVQPNSSEDKPSQHDGNQAAATSAH